MLVTMDLDGGFEGVMLEMPKGMTPPSLLMLNRENRKAPLSRK
jgi:hypothetical protein